MSKENKPKKQKSLKKIITITVLIAVAVFFLFPRRYSYLDGGSVAYGSFDLGFTYKVEQRHRLPSVEDADVSVIMRMGLLYQFLELRYTVMHTRITTI